MNAFATNYTNSLSNLAIRSYVNGIDSKFIIND